MLIKNDNKRHQMSLKGQLEFRTIPRSWVDQLLFISIFFVVWNINFHLENPPPPPPPPPPPHHQSNNAKKTTRSNRKQLPPLVQHKRGGPWRHSAFTVAAAAAAAAAGRRCGNGNWGSVPLAVNTSIRRLKQWPSLARSRRWFTRAIYQSTRQSFTWFNPSSPPASHTHSPIESAPLSIGPARQIGKLSIGENIDKYRSISINSDCDRGATNNWRANEVNNKRRKIIWDGNWKERHKRRDRERRGEREKIGSQGGVNNATLRRRPKILHIRIPHTHFITFFPILFRVSITFFFFLLGVVLFSFFYFLFFWRFLVIDTRFFQCDSGPRGNFSRFQRRFSLWKPGNRPLIDLFHQFRYSSTKFMLNIWGFQLSFPLNADSLVQIRSALMAERRSVIHSRNSVLKWQ